MALGTNISDSYFPQTTKPQTNQYLTGDVASQGEKAQTSWMDPNTSNWGKYSGGMGGQPSQPTTTPQAGTALGAIQAGSGSIGAGNVGQYMPGGYDAGKFGDQSHNTPKYVIGRILSKYPQGPAGFEAAKSELMATGLIGSFGKDGFTLNDQSGYGGHYIDAGKSFSDPNAQHEWQWLDQFGSGQGQPGNSYFGQQQGNGQQGFMQLLQQLLGGQAGGQNMNFRALQNQGQLNTPAPYRQQNPMGGFTPSNGNTGFAGGVDRGVPQMQQGTQIPGYEFNPGSQGFSYLNGAPNYDPRRGNIQ